MSNLWTEKYRPRKFEDVKGQDVAITKIKAFVEQQNMPHLLFTGPAGVGKTSLALVVVKSLFKDQWHQNFLELNASDERGIDVVRNKVKDFARTKAIGNVPFKIIYLDECDALTKEAQQALRRTMENYTSTCRFILSANYSSKIIDPIQSRCAVFRFKPLPKHDVVVILDKIAYEEGLTINNEAKEALYQVCEGDCRRMENILQSCAVLEKNITPQLIFSMAAVAEPEEIKEMLNLASQGKFAEARSRLLSIMLNYGLSGIDIVKQIQKAIWDLSLTDRQKIFLIDKCAEAEFRMVEGSDAYLQLEAFLAQVGITKEK
ncbi:replication factor C small subunit [Candidatus Woesearchaeota archaeon]|nr:replication factor C small subunit [Candidatus Woesearchaeota archaeon]